jgi:hypothetical protein
MPFYANEKVEEVFHFFHIPFHFTNIHFSSIVGASANAVKIHIWTALMPFVRSPSP